MTRPSGCDRRPTTTVSADWACARGEADAWSDVDLMTVAPSTRPFVDRSRDYGDLLDAPGGPPHRLRAPDRLGQICVLIADSQSQRYTRDVIPREMGRVLAARARKFPVVALTGPRQSGKTTLVRTVFATLPYVSLEDPDVRELALADPRTFLGRYRDGVVLDEAQRAPELFSYLQGIVDASRRRGRFILTGSHHFLLMERIGQSLAGRVAILHLPPLGQDELSRSRLLPASPEAAVFHGGYPPLFDRRVAPAEWFPSYVQTYLERDVRLVRDVSDLAAFHRFLRLCAGRSGQILNVDSLASDAGIAPNTAKAWLSVLEASFVVHFLPPHFANFGKRLTKAPKLHFLDTGLACHLIGIRSVSQLEAHPCWGALFESYVVSEVRKRHWNVGSPGYLFYWRDRTGHEIDLLVERGGELVPVEVKASRTVTAPLFASLEWWCRIARRPTAGAILIHGGDETHRRGAGRALSWRRASTVVTPA